MASGGSLLHDPDLDQRDLSSLEGDIDLDGASGNIAGKQLCSPNQDTLDEPVLTSISRDLKAVGTKLLAALLPAQSRESNKVLTRDWDLWGPLILCIYIGLILQEMNQTSASSRFTIVFLLVWLGIVVSTYNAVFVQKASISMFQCACVIGYCLVPLAGAVSILELLHILAVAGDQIALRILLVIVSVVWASFASVKILQGITEEEKKFVVLGPIVLLYVAMGILIALYTYSDSYYPEKITSQINLTRPLLDP